MKKFVTTSDKDTKRLAKEKASEFKGGEVVGLVGDLGAGKTTFVQGIAEYFGITEHVSSPTFTLINEYKLPVTDYGLQITSLIHIDCYRLNNPQELLDIGIEEYFEQDDIIILIEWAEKVKEVLPKRIKWIEFEYGDTEKERKVVTQ